MPTPAAAAALGWAQPVIMLFLPLGCCPAHSASCSSPGSPPCRRMDEVCGQSRLFAREGESVRLPVAHMVCNQTPPVGDKPSLMTFRWAARLGGRVGGTLGAGDVGKGLIVLCPVCMLCKWHSPHLQVAPPLTLAVCSSCPPFFSCYPPGRLRRCSTSLGTPRSTC